MPILHLYQLAFIATVVVTFLVSARVKKQVVAGVVPAQPISKPVAASIDLVKERIRQLDKLFDDNVLSVDEYVELRKRISGETAPGQPT
jgi:hypothetical protein